MFRAYFLVPEGARENIVPLDEALELLGDFDPSLLVAGALSWVVGRIGHLISVLCSGAAHRGRWPGRNSYEYIVLTEAAQMLVCEVLIRLIGDLWTITAFVAWQTILLLGIGIAVQWESVFISYNDAELYAISSWVKYMQDKNHAVVPI